MLDLFNTWTPTLRGNDEPTYSLMVSCGDNPPDSMRYRSLLRAHLERLIRQDPKQARKDLEMISSADSPGLSDIIALFEPEEWALQIILSPPMAMLLNRIDWQRINPVEISSPDELPGLIQILELMP